MSATPRVLPQPTPETRHFWEGCRQNELRLQRCLACARSYFPPRPFCPHCGSREVEIYVASGRATLYSYVINHRPRRDVGTEPHSIAVVSLAEGPRMMTNILNCPQTPEALRLDMPLRVLFLPQSDEITLPFFEPAPEGTTSGAAGTDEAIPGGTVQGEAVPGEAVQGEAVQGDAIPGDAIPGDALLAGAAP